MSEEIEKSEQKEEEVEEEEEDEERVLLESESQKSLSQIASFLKGLSDQIEKGSVTMKQGENLITLTLPETMTLEVEVEEEGEGSKKKLSLEIEIEWYEEDIAKGALELE
ncbi:MAG: amphi-Trp domain-containing protein [Candidatus Hodarchaeota archaeon]